MQNAKNVDMKRQSGKFSNKGKENLERCDQSIDQKHNPVLNSEMYWVCADCGLVLEREFELNDKRQLYFISLRNGELDYTIFPYYKKGRFEIRKRYNPRMGKLNRSILVDQSSLSWKRTVDDIYTIYEKFVDNALPKTEMIRGMTRYKQNCEKNKIALIRLHLLFVCIAIHRKTQWLNIVQIAKICRVELNSKYNLMHAIQRYNELQTEDELRIINRKTTGTDFLQNLAEKFQMKLQQDELDAFGAITLTQSVRKGFDLLCIIKLCRKEDINSFGINVLSTYDRNESKQRLKKEYAGLKIKKEGLRNMLLIENYDAFLQSVNKICPKNPFRLVKIKNHYGIEKIATYRNYLQSAMN